MYTEKELLPARVTIGYGERRFSVFPDEITNFLIDCDEIGLNNMKEITNELEDIAALIADSAGMDAEPIKRKLGLLTALGFLMKGAIFEEK